MIERIMNRLGALGAQCLLLCSMGCANHDGAYYADIPHVGEKKVTITAIQADTIYPDAAQTSLLGEWLMKDSVLYFIDNYAVGVKAYDKDGNFISENIRQGKGPNEMTLPALISAFDEKNGNLVIHDKFYNILRFTPNYEMTYNSNKGWLDKLDADFDKAAVQELYENPDPEVPQMYDYNLTVRRMLCRADTVYLPVVTEHVSYNGYETSCNARDFWRISYLFLTFAIDDLEGSHKLFGHYPPAYYKKNIPVFSTYDFCMDREFLYVSFAADPLIYALDKQGKVLFSFGFADPDIAGDYPQTTTLEEYDEEFERQRAQYGYYDRIFLVDDLLFRTCKTDKNIWKLQLYRDYDLVGDIVIDGPMEVLGEYDGRYYAFVDVDLANECFKIIRFSYEE